MTLPPKITPDDRKEPMDTMGDDLDFPADRPVTGYWLVEVAGEAVESAFGLARAVLSIRLRHISKGMERMGKAMKLDDDEEEGGDQ